MHTLIRKGLLPVAAALITSLTILGPLGGLPAAAQTAPGAISLQRAETIARLRTYIPAGFTLSSTSYNAAQTGQPAQYNLNYVKNGAQQNQSFGIGVSVDATTGMILNYYRQPAVNAFHFPASVSAVQAKALAATWVRRLYGAYSKQVVSAVALALLVTLMGTAYPDVATFPAGEQAANFIPLGVAAYFGILSGVGAIALFGGAVYSWIKSRKSYNLWIALGALIFSVGGVVGSAVGVYQLFYVFQAVGSIVLYRGIALTFPHLVRRGSGVVRRQRPQ